jgi:starch phosphorylase
MKVSCNGGINLSILDGWWDEGYEGNNGWAIGKGEEYTDLNYQDDVESRAIYDTLEQEIVPLFYTRSSDGLPRGWVRMMKQSLMTLCPRFNTSRMLAEYLSVCYLPAADRFDRLTGESLTRARRLANWRRRARGHWSQIQVAAVEANGADPIQVGGELKIQAQVALGDLTPEDVEVQIFHGQVDSFGDIPHPQTVAMSANGSAEGGRYLFQGTIPCQASGQHGFAVRVLPRHADLANPYEPGLVCWG